MASAFTDYCVVSVLNSGQKGSASYSVQSKNTGSLYVWQPVECKPCTQNERNALMKDVQKLIDVNNQNLVKCLSYVEHEGTGTLYLVKEIVNGNVSALIRKCKSTNSFIDETFLWKIVYQIAYAAQAMYARGPTSAYLDITARGVHLNDDGDVKLDYWYTFEDEEDDISNGENHVMQRKQKKSDIFDLGCLMYSMASLQTQIAAVRGRNQKIPPHYSTQLQSLIDILTTDNEQQRPTIEAVLYHPSVVSQVVTTSFQKLSIQHLDALQSACEKCKEYSIKKTALRKKEAFLNAKEKDLNEKELILERREKHVCLKEKLLKEKLSAIDESTESKFKNRPQQELDSSGYCADLGHYTTIMPTVAKLDPTIIRRPASFAASGSGSSNKSVRFEAMAERENKQPLETKNECQLWLRNKRAKYKTNTTKWKTMKAAGKENLIPRKNPSLTSLGPTTQASSNGLLETIFR